MYIYIYIYIYVRGLPQEGGLWQGPEVPHAGEAGVCRQGLIESLYLSLSLYIYIYIHIYICVYIYICIYIYIYIFFKGGAHLLDAQLQGHLREEQRLRGPLPQNK